MKRPSESPAALRRTWLATQVAGRFSTRLAGLIAGRLWFTPWVVDNGDRGRARHARWLEGTRPHSIPFEETWLAGFDQGQGPTVLLVHGWGERAATLGALVRPLADRGFRVVGVDLPAHGDSPGRRTNILEGAAALQTIVEQLGDVHAVIAHSMGCAVTTYALDQGLDVDRVVLVAPAVRLERALDVFVEMSQLPPRAVTGLRRYIERRFGQSVWEDFAADRLAKGLEVPALVVHDRNDEQVPFEDGELMASCWPGARFIPTEGLGHMKVLGDVHVIDEIGNFLKAGASPSTQPQRFSLSAASPAATDGNQKEPRQIPSRAGRSANESITWFG